MPRRFMLTVAYDGRPFSGWQSQPDGNTVQDALQEAAAAIAGQTVAMHGAGRTDAGVHALGQAVHFDAPRACRMDAAAWQRALHSHLPPSVRVLAAREVDAAFHCRYSASAKTYRYEIDVDPVPHPLRHRLAWPLRQSPDADTLRDAVARFSGRHDFASFAAHRRHCHPPRTTVREITRAEVAERRAPSGSAGASGFDITFTGDGFLYKMVRLMVGAAVECARGRHEPSWITHLLDRPADAARRPPCAPPDGLYLVSVDYPTPQPTPPQHPQHPRAC